MFVKLINEYQVEKAPRCIHVGSTTYVIPTAEQYALADYFELVEQKQPEERKWYNLIPTYEKKGDKILQGWEYKKQSEPVYEELVVGYIREQYSLNDELAILRQGLSGTKKGDFDDYNAYCESCKNTANKDLEEWKKA